MIEEEEKEEEEEDWKGQVEINNGGGGGEWGGGRRAATKVDLKAALASALLAVVVMFSYHGPRYCTELNCIGCKQK